MDSKRREQLALTIGAAIAQERLKAALTKETVAQALGIGPKAVSRIERGLVLPSLARLMDFAELFGCPVPRLLGLGSDPVAERDSFPRSLIGPWSDADRQYVTELVERIQAQLAASK